MLRWLENLSSGRSTTGAVALLCLAPSMGVAQAEVVYDSIPVNGISMAYRDMGAGEPVVLLHGFMASGNMWDQTGMVEALDMGYRLIIPDLRGRGRSLDPSGAFTPGQSAEDVFALLDHLGLERVQVIGLSGGALSLLHMGTSQPERIEAMILISGGHYLATEARDLIRQDRPVDEIPVAVLEHMAAMNGHVGGVEQFRQIVRAFQSAPEDYDVINFTPPYLATITARTLVIHGDRDQLFPLRIPVEMYQSIPDAALWILPDVDHESLWGSPTWSSRVVETSSAFLAGGVSDDT